MIETWFGFFRSFLRILHYENTQKKINGQVITCDAIS